MAITTVPYLRLTDGTTTLNLVDGTNYALERGSWAPQVARRRRSTLGGRAYENVVETIPLIVRAATAALALENVAAISKLLDQAERWTQDENVAAVRILYQTHGSEATAPMEALVLGRAEDSDSFLLPLTFEDVGMHFQIHGVVLRFIRDGTWYGPEETITIAKSSHPSVGSGSFATAAYFPSPVKLAIGTLPKAATIAGYDTGFVLLAGASTRLAVVDAVDYALGPDWTTNADATRKPQGTGVLIYTPPDALENTSASSTVAGLGGGRRLGIVAALRNTHASTEFSVRVEVTGDTVVLTRPYIVDSSTTDPRIVLLGVVECEDPLGYSIRLKVTASAAAGTLVFDYLAFIVLDDPTSRILTIGPIANSVVDPDTASLVIDPRALTAQSPQVRFKSTTNPTTDYNVPDFYRGDAFLQSIGTAIAVLFCARNSVGGYWTAYDSVLVGSIDADFVLTRRITYLSPI